MVYSSLLFIYGFFPAALLLYLATPRKLKDICLFIESIIFCGMLGLKYLIFVIIFVTVNYISARLTYSLKGENSRYKDIPIAFGIVFDILSLLAFRAEFIGMLRVPVGFSEGFYAVGISLYTLSAIGYLSDIYTGKSKADVNFVRFALYIMMFPRLFMGPVVSYDYFIRIMKHRRINMNELGKGIITFIKGLAKKIILGDMLYMMYSAIAVSEITKLSAVSAWLGIIAFMLCLYFSLSGMADMGIGIARCFGFDFPNSFNYPLFSDRVRYFGSRWHMPIVQWFKKYAVRPLMSRTGRQKYEGFIIVLLWMLVGFWYTFGIGGIMWGAIIGAAIIIESKLKSFKMLNATGIVFTLAVLVLSAVFLSHDSAADSFRYLWAMLGGNRAIADSLTTHLLRSYSLVLLVSCYAAADFFKNTIARASASKLRIVISVAQPIVMLAMLIVCTALISYSGSSEMLIMRL